MKVEHVFHEKVFAALAREEENILGGPDHRRGQTVQDHLPQDFLIFRFLTKLGLASTGPMLHFIATSQVPPPYSPCLRPLNELGAIKLADMKLHTHHRGRKITVRVCTPPHRMTAIMAIVEDEQGTALLLQLHHQPDENIVPAKELIQPGTILVLKEPYITHCVDGAYSLRVDHVSDVVWLEGAEELVPPKWRQPSLTLKDSARTRMQGNQAVQKGNWVEALRL
jgi:hypothetical protein